MSAYCSRVYVLMVAALTLMVPTDVSVLPGMCLIVLAGSVLVSS